MFEVVIDSLKYVVGVPVEQTEAAVLAGGIGGGSVLGLVVYPVGDESNKMVLEVRLSEEGQLELIRPGQIVPLDGEGGVYRFNRDWRCFISKTLDSMKKYVEYDISSDNGHFKADSGLF